MPWVWRMIGATLNQRSLNLTKTLLYITAPTRPGVQWYLKCSQPLGPTRMPDPYCHPQLVSESATAGLRVGARQLPSLSLVGSQNRQYLERLLIRRGCHRWTGPVTHHTPQSPPLFRFTIVSDQPHVEHGQVLFLCKGRKKARRIATLTCQS